MTSALSSAASICTSSVSEMPREIVNHLYETGAFLIFLNVPEETEFGIDYKSWNVGAKFLGLKMIPPGVHFIYFSVKNAPRIGFFHFFQGREVLIRKWDKSAEDMLNEVVAEDEVSRIKGNLKNMDKGLAPYPYETYRNWFALSNHITEQTVGRLSPENQYGRITNQTELITLENLTQDNDTDGCSSSQVTRAKRQRLRFVDEQGLPIMTVKPGFEIRFTIVPQYESSVKSVFSTNMMDSTERLEQIINYSNNSPSEIIAELQFAFVCFLLGQVYEGFEQWKRLILIFSSCRAALLSHTAIYEKLLQVLFFQLKECPEDFFVDIVTKDNFLTTTLSRLFANIEDFEGVPESLKKLSAKFKAFLTKRFKWDFNEMDRESEQVSLIEMQ